MTEVFESKCHAPTRDGQMLLLSRYKGSGREIPACYNLIFEEDAVKKFRDPMASSNLQVAPITFMYIGNCGACFCLLCGLQCAGMMGAHVAIRSPFRAAPT